MRPRWTRARQNVLPTQRAGRWTSCPAAGGASSTTAQSATTIAAARQLVNHGHIMINQSCVSIPSYQCQPGDNLSVKNNNNGNLITPSSLTYSLQEAKDQCLKTLGKNRIVHMLIDKYKIDNQSYFSLPENIKCEFRVSMNNQSLFLEKIEII